MSKLSKTEINSFIDSDNLVKDWLRKYSDQTRYTYAFQFIRFFRWVQAKHGFKAPADLIDDHVKSQKDESVHTRKKHSMLVKEYVLDNPAFKELSDAGRQLIVASISSFYNYCEAPLTSFKGEFKFKGYAKYEYRQFGVPDARKIVDAAPQREKAIFMMMLQAGLRIGDLLNHVNYRWSEIKPQLDYGKDPLKLTMYGGQYWTYITTDAIQELKKYVIERGEPREGEPIFATSTKKPVYAVYVEDVLQRIGVKIGLIAQHELQNLKVGHHYPVRLHMFRKLFKSEASVAGRGIDQRYVEFFMGHAGGLAQIGGIYDRSPELHEEIFEKEYQKIAPYVNIFTGITSIEQRLKEIEKIRADLGPEMIDRMTRAGIKMRKAKPLKRLKENGEKGNPTEIDCRDGEHCEFKQVKEFDLLQHLRDGWTITHKLSDGEIIIRRK
jgi:integrase